MGLLFASSFSKAKQTPTTLDCLCALSDEDNVFFLIERKNKVFAGTFSWKNKSNEILHSRTISIETAIPVTVLLASFHSCEMCAATFTSLCDLPTHLLFFSLLAFAIRWTQVVMHDFIASHALRRTGNVTGGKGVLCLSLWCFYRLLFLHEHFNNSNGGSWCFKLWSMEFLMNVNRKASISVHAPRKNSTPKNEKHSNNACYHNRSLFSEN